VLGSGPGCGTRVSDRELKRYGEAPLRHKGLLLRRQKRYPEAVATLDQALAQAPNDAPVLLAGQPQRARVRLHELRGRPW
jgi:regulator of sirC expression with transglutaminase-like and TPR domain